MPAGLDTLLSGAQTTLCFTCSLHLTVRSRSITPLPPLPLPRVAFSPVCSGDVHRFPVEFPSDSRRRVALGWRAAEKRPSTHRHLRVHRDHFELVLQNCGTSGTVVVKGQGRSAGTK